MGNVQIATLQQSREGLVACHRMQAPSNIRNAPAASMDGEMGAAFDILVGDEGLRSSGLVYTMLGIEFHRLLRTVVHISTKKPNLQTTNTSRYCRCVRTQVSMTKTLTFLLYQSHSIDDYSRNNRS